jgi:short-subunit dehydrogenase
MATRSEAVLITGCSTGIGAATALRLAKAGHTVYATARHKDQLGDLAAAGCRTLALDVTDEASMQAAVAEVEGREGAVGVLINNAGYSQSGALETLPMDRVRAQFETNVFGLLRLSQLVLPGMRAQGRGRIVNISSMGGKLTLPGGGAYHATKYAVEAMSDALRFEVKGFGVDVILIEPGLIRTHFADTVVGGMSGLGTADGPYASFNKAVETATREAYVKGPLARLGGSADDVAKVITRALDARRPKARYRVTASAHMMMTQRALMSDSLWDSFLGTIFPKPGPQRGR